MKTALRLLFASALLASTAFGASPFEGKMTLKMTSGGGKAQEIQYSLKGDKMRLDFPGMKGAGMIVDTAKKETTMLMDEQKMYMTMPMPDVATMASGGGKSEDVKLEKTSQTEKILGYTATKFLSTHQGTTTELWLAEGLGTFFSPGGGNPMAGGRGNAGPAPQAWEKALAGKALFPLRVVAKDKSGKESFRMEATAIDKQSLPESLFSPPADYQAFQMGGMGGMMKGMIPSAPR